ncbi:MAG: SGNH/GDSL hydrolase family protein [Microcoleaceae cyanobacterium]
MKKQFIAAGISVISVILPLKAIAANFTEIYIFGDSLSDTGNVFDFTLNSIPPSPPYFEGRFSNGLIWIDYLAEDLGLNPATYSDVVLENTIPTEGINFAFGGATTGGENTVSLAFPTAPDLPGLPDQISLFTANFSTIADADALYIIWAGSNDYLPTESTFEPLTSSTVSINNISNAITALANVGAENIVVVNLPNLGDTPVALNANQAEPGITNRLNTLSAEHNTALAAEIDDLTTGLAPDINLISFDLNALFTDVFNNPETFNLTNVTNGCLLIECTNPDEFLFWDAQHVTTAANQLIADAALQTLDASSIPEPNFKLGILAFGIWAASQTIGYKKNNNNRKI